MLLDNPRTEAPLPLSDDQAAAWAMLAARLKAHGVDIEAGDTTPRTEAAGEGEVLAITGKAGSGKTVLLARLAHGLAAAGLRSVRPDYEPKRRDARSFAVLAPTNKAASVLQARGVPATTIHRIVYTPVYDPDFEEIAEWIAGERHARPATDAMTPEALDRAKASFESHGSVASALAAAGVRGSDFITGWKRRDEPLDIALVDEASMIEPRQLQDLSEIFGLVILFGDPAQLAPVGERGAMVFDSLPPARRLALSRIHRQAEDSPILDLAHLLGREGLSFEAFEDAVREAATRDPRVVIAPRADADLMCESPMLVWRNKTRLRLIAAFRAAHGIAPDALAPGEPLICDGLELPLKRRKERIALEAHGLIKGAQAVYLGPGARPAYQRVRIIGTGEPGVSVASIIQIEQPDGAEPLLVSAARMGAVFLHGAAVTIHKAQGSQWPRVQVFAPDLWAAARAGQTEAGLPLWARLAYVAITRAERELVWVTRAMIGRAAKPLGGAQDG
ncbi:AAA family ATPase [Limibaculum sp. FT325]|uniref:AAA family ATPase n=1 Tax=Thermohalobaculum sediminis TaxID=2939436 RepID=UPI0020BD62A3|nr:AAA family ATPase [Limibaculum sediminis]MCL5776791.1 AAA family ATPase [Limibaculum sediminis]